MVVRIERTVLHAPKATSSATKPYTQPGTDPTSERVLAGHVIYDADQVLVSAGLTSLTLLTDDGSDSTDVFAGVSAEVAVGRVRPGLTLRAPLSDNYLNSVVGLRLTVGL